jgi:hypothetical protein
LRRQIRKRGVGRAARLDRQHRQKRASTRRCARLAPTSRHECIARG